MAEHMSGAEQSAILLALVASLDTRPSVARIEVGTLPLPVRHAVHWHAPGGSEHLGTSRLVSILGLTFESSHALLEGANLEMDVDLPDGKHLVGLATVEEVTGNNADGWVIAVRFGDAALTREGERPLAYLDMSLRAG